MSDVPLFLVDAFASRPFAGNPAAVCLLDRERTATWMQSLAMEMNQAETAFVLRQGDGFGLRWFTPEAEVDLCGHATLASAHALLETGAVPAHSVIRFATRSGELSAERAGDRIRLDFPATPVEPAPLPPGLLEALRLREPPRFIGRTRFDAFVEVASEAAVRAVEPDFDRLRALAGRGVIVAAPADSPDFDFVSRFFAPQVGIPEDPATGSAHCALGPYFAARTGKTELSGLQLSRRTGEIGVRLRGDRVDLLGRAVTVLRGSLSDRARE